MRCLGQRGHTWGEPDWERIDSTRTLAAWLDDGSGVLLTAVRPAGAAAHEERRHLGDRDRRPPATCASDEPRLSTTYDEAGRQRSAGLELWIGEDDAYPRRASGEVVCGSTLELGQLRLDCAFVRWHMGGRSGIGRYDAPAARMIEAVDLRLRRRAHDPAAGGVRRGPGADRRPARGVRRGDGATASSTTASTRCSRSSAARSPRRDFLARLENGLADAAGLHVSLHGFGARLMDALRPNQELFDRYRALQRERGLRFALCTNNVREWEPLWRPMLPIDEVFEVVVDSAFVGMRKPEPAIYALTLERLGLPAEACAFVDDLEVNVAAAQKAGMQGIVFRDTASAVAELEALLNDE